ncbi:MAG TPA: MATE family efflux transporter [Actinomycetota bacterium]|nr:MATE family efflux transporter [Actinomycetota bacterium]
MDPDLTQEAGETAQAAELEAAARRPRGSDQRVIVGQTGQNVLGLGIGAAATFAAQVIMANQLGETAYGVVTLTTQFAFIAAAATRFGMDVANIRLVAILVGRDEAGRVRGLVRRSGAIAFLVSVPVAIVVFALAPWLADTFSTGAGAEEAFRWAAVTIPLAALAFAYMGATRGLKIMRYTLFAQWITQPIGWIVLTLALWQVAERTSGIATAAFGASWAAALAIAYAGWRREESRLPRAVTGDGIAEERSGSLWRFGALRAPGTLFSQLIFWTDLFVVGVLFGRAGSDQVGVYSGVLRAGQSLFLFLTSVSLTFSPFVADLHHRGERGRLDQLYKQVTRWTLAATIPVLLVLAVLPELVLRVFGPEFTTGSDALRILIVGMIAPVMVGTVGFILIMAGRTGWDLVVYVGGVVIDVGLALALARPDVLGIRGAAIAQAATLTVSAIARLVLVKRFLGIWPFDASFLRLVIPAVVGAAAMVGAHGALTDGAWLLDLAGSALAGTVAYVVAMLAVGVTPAERTALRRLVARVAGGAR